MDKPLFITFEGGEGSGKTTLIDKIHAELKRRGRKVTKTREPGGCPVGDRIREILLVKKDVSLAPKSELLLFLASRAQKVRDIIAPALERGEIVLCDRFNDSTIAYQAAGRHIDEIFVRALCNFVTGEVRPDLTLFLDLDPEEGLRRVHKEKRTEAESGHFDRIEEEELSFHKEVYNAYHKILETEAPRIVALDASKSPQEVFEAAMRKIEPKL